MRGRNRVIDRLSLPLYASVLKKNVTEMNRMQDDVTKANRYKSRSDVIVTRIAWGSRYILEHTLTNTIARSLDSRLMHKWSSCSVVSHLYPQYFVLLHLFKYRRARNQWNRNLLQQKSILSDLSVALLSNPENSVDSWHSNPSTSWVFDTIQSTLPFWDPTFRFSIRVFGSP